MRMLFGILIGWAWLVTPAGAIDALPDFDDPVLQARYERLIHELRCLQCQNNSIADSPGGLAEDLRRSVHELLRQGKTDQEVLEFMTSRYGDFVLYRPPLVPRTWLLWFAPVLLFGTGVFVAFRIIRARSRLPIEDDGEDDPESGAAEAGGR